MLLVLSIAMAGRYQAQATLKRALFYGPTSDTSVGVAEMFVNDPNNGVFEPIDNNNSMKSQVWDVGVWATKTTADFAAFDIIVFGDQPAGSTDATRWDAAILNRSVWSAAVTGNALIFGGDPDNPGHPGTPLVQGAMLFGANQDGYVEPVTGIYVALSQVDFGTFTTPESVELLEGIGIFNAIGGGANHVTVVASHPVLDCLPSGSLANWGFSAHQGFHSWPSTFIPLAIVTDANTSTPGFTPPCSSYADCGAPALVYILARGNFNKLTATPCVQAGHTGTPGDQRTVTATFKTTPGDMPLPGRRIGFNVVGVNSAVGLPSNFVTDNNGQVSFTYTGGVSEGKDTITVFVDVNQNNLQDECEPETTAICNWGNPIVTVTAVDASAAEFPTDTGKFRLSRAGSTAGDLTISYCLTGTAEFTTDYTLNPGSATSVTIPNGNAFVDVVLTPVNDDLFEGSETATLTLQDGTGYAVGPPFQATVTIADDDGIVTITAAALSAKEGDLEPSSFIFHRAGSTAQDLTVFFQLPVVSGGALLGADYTLNLPVIGEATIPAGAAFLEVAMQPLQDSRNEGTEVATINLLPDPTYVLGTPASASIQIKDNDSVPLPLSYTITEIGPANKHAHAFGVNSAGVVAGDYRINVRDGRGFSWQNGTLTLLPSPDGCVYGCGSSYGLGVNDSGAVVGYGGDGVDVPFVWSAGVMTPLGVLASSSGNQAAAINSAGYMVGFCRNSSGKTHAVLWFAGMTTAQDWGTLAGFDDNKDSFATGINSAGRVVGKSMISADNTTFHAFRTQTLLAIDAANDLGNAVGVETANSEANWINDLNEVVGATTVASGQSHAFWKDGHSGKHQAFIDLGVLPGDNYSVALGLNNTGHSVGYSKNTATGIQRAVVWFNNGVMHDLITKVTNGSGWTLKSAEAINNSGWIVGWGVKNGYDRAFLLTPNY